MPAELRLVQLGEIVAGRYRVQGPIGEGGFGSVFCAVQLTTGQQVALKVLQEHHIDGSGQQRFEREARLARQLSHPNTVRLLDFGETEHGAPFIVFELLAGESLGALFRRQGALPPARVAHIASQVLKSLMEAHALGIVHRDIKPTNLFLCDFAGAPDFVKVLDFGIAKRDSPNTKALTEQGEVVGTPAYMAPEHVAGRPLTGSADLYSLGLVMAELLAGSRIYQGDPVSICLEQLSDSPVPLPRAVLDTPLGAIVRRATQKSPAYRYATAADMLRDLTLAEGGLTDRTPDASQWVTMHRPPVAMPVPVPSDPRSIETALQVPHFNFTAPGSHPLAPSAVSLAPGSFPTASSALPAGAPPSVAQPALQRRFRWLPWLGAAIALLILAGAAGGIAYWRYSPARAPVAAGAAAPAGKLDGLNATVIADRARRAGYRIVSSADRPKSVSVILSGNGHVGHIDLLRLPTARGAQMACQTGHSCITSGTCALSVTLVSLSSRQTDPAAERSLLDAILRGP